MGAWGYGVYESDNSLDTLQNIFEYIDVNYQELKLKDGKVIDTLWSPNEGLLDDKIIKKILKNLKGLEENVLKSDFKDSEEENYLLMCNILTTHSIKIPTEFLNKSINLIESMTSTDGSSSNYDYPQKRNMVLFKELIPLYEQKFQNELPIKNKTKISMKVKL